ncbi:hypothetical protein [Methylomonas rhizoryzae]|uniref:hypothetical protein n=1 Tax=Methylomonas rhizoryzae TaxID=2608981 RepID=UPI0012323C00|nr:hypothetical protein [Methylomonas rhizoryzae]
MTQSKDLEAWFAGDDLWSMSPANLEEWVAGFDADRQLVVFKLGPFQHLFLRPERFNKRFYHQIYPLVIESWPYRRQIKLFDDFCTLSVELDIRFQATLAYARRNSELLDNLNRQIKSIYAGVVEDRINWELSALADGCWVRDGLLRHERNLALSICEIFTQRQIQAEAVCRMSVDFVDFPEVKLGKDSVYLHVLKRTFEINQEKHQEMDRQQQLNQQQALASKQQELEHLKQLMEMQRLIQLQEAEAQIQLLQDKEQQLARQREVETRLHAEQVRHEQHLMELSLEIELHARQQREARQRLAETQDLANNLEHKAMLEDKQTAAEIQRQVTTKRLWEESGESLQGGNAQDQ